VSEPVIPIQNIYYLLCYAWKQLDEAKKVNVSASDYKQYADLFAKVLVNGCTYVFKRGLDREYRFERDELCRIRGKIDFNQSIKNISVKSRRLICEYDELSTDTLHNQIIKATAKKLLKVKDLDKNIRYELREIYRKLLQIRDIDLECSHFKKVKLHRNNLFYRFVLNVSRIIHENIVLDEKTGEYEFVDFIRDEKKMASVFEHFVRNFYRENLRIFGFEVKPEILSWDVDETDEASLEYLPTMKTDISITSATRKIIIDTKYYKECFQEHYDKRTIISAHMYQLIEYLENSDKQSGMDFKSEGMLLYPAVSHEEAIPFQRLRGHKITIRTINLNQEWKGIASDLMNFVNQEPYTRR
jgi:5-methylcytosine-specific restriction enzyme subunit McrC